MKHVWARTMKHDLLQGLTAPILTGMLLTIAVSNGTSFVSVEGRVQEIQSHKFTRVHREMVYFMGFTAPYLMGMSQYFYIPLHPTVLVSCP